MNILTNFIFHSFFSSFGPDGALAFFFSLARSFLILFVAFDHDSLKSDPTATKCLDTSRVVSEKILKQFGMRISSGLIRRYIRKFGKNIHVAKLLKKLLLR